MVFFPSQLLVTLPEGIFIPSKKKNGPRKSSNRRGLPKKLDLRSTNVVILEPALGGFGTIGIHMCLAKQREQRRGREESMSPGKKKTSPVFKPQGQAYL